MDVITASLHPTVLCGQPIGRIDRVDDNGGGEDGSLTDNLTCSTSSAINILSSWYIQYHLKTAPGVYQVSYT